MAIEHDGKNVSHINANRPGWHRVLLVEFTENDLVEITTALKHYHEELVDQARVWHEEDWPEVRQSLRKIIAKCYTAREIEDNDMVREE